MKVNELITPQAAEKLGKSLDNPTKLQKANDGRPQLPPQRQLKLIYVTGLLSLTH